MARPVNWGVLNGPCLFQGFHWVLAKVTMMKQQCQNRLRDLLEDHKSPPSLLPFQHSTSPSPATLILPTLPSSPLLFLLLSHSSHIFLNHSLLPLGAPPPPNVSSPSSSSIPLFSWCWPNSVVSDDPEGLSLSPTFDLTGWWCYSEPPQETKITFLKYNVWQAETFF